MQTKIIEKYGYDKPVAERYVITMKGLLINGDFGESIIRPGEHLQEFKLKLPVTIRLSVQQFIRCDVRHFIGNYRSYEKGDFWDKLILVGAMILVSMPSLVISLLLQKYCANGSFLKLPIIGWPKKRIMVGGWKYTILPTIAGYCSLLPIIQDLPKQVCWKAINQEYTLTARSKGLSELQIVKNHVIRNHLFNYHCTSYYSSRYFNWFSVY